jgi:asparagine synthetase B (glutamine-hydrolysing)
MYLMARRIKAMGIKMVLSGEGATRSSAATCTSTRRPMPRSFHEETVRKLFDLHLFDCLRANKSMAAWGVEARVPFLDKQFLDVAMRLHPAQDVRRRPDREARPARGLRGLAARVGPVAAEGAVLRRRRLRLDRHA